MQNQEINRINRDIFKNSVKVYLGERMMELVTTPGFKDCDLVELASKFEYEIDSAFKEAKREYVNEMNAAFSSAKVNK